MAGKASTTRAPKRPGPKRRDLTRARLVAAAIWLLDEGGVAALSMRSVADAVGVTPMALYNHFAGKRELLRAVADGMISEGKFDGGHAEWRRQIGHCFTALRTLCISHPALPELLQQEGAVPPSASVPMQLTVRALTAAGIGEIDALRCFFVLIGYTLSQTAYQARPIPALDPLEPGSCVTLHGIGDAPGWNYDESFAFGLGLVLDGIDAAVNRAARGCG